MEQSDREKEIVDIIQDERSKHKGKQPMSPQRGVKVAEEKSALDSFEYLEFEQSEEGSSVAAFRSVFCIFVTYEK